MITNLTEKESKDVLRRNYLGNIAYIYGHSPFMVPMTYYFDGENTIIGYSSEGHKTKAMRKNDNVSLHLLEMKDMDNWTSVLALGQYEELIDGDAKAYLRKFAKGVKELILRREEKNLHFISEFSSKKYDENPSIIFKITIDEINGRNRIH